MPPTVFRDISQVQMSKGDYVVFDDRETGTRYTLEVIETLPDDSRDPTVARYKMRIIESTNPALENGAIIPEFRVDRSRQIWGQVIRSDEHSMRLSAVDLDNFCAIELRKYLDRCPNYKARFQECVEFLVRSRALPEKDGTTTGTINYKYVQQLCKRFERYMVSRGGMIRSTGAQINVPGHEFGKGGQMIEIDFRLLVLGLKNVLESVSIIRLKNAE